MEILEAFDGWRKPPAAVLADSEALQAYAHLLHTVSGVFAEAGEPSLAAMLQGAGDNPIDALERDLAQAGALHAAGRFAEELVVLETLEAQLRHLKGPMVDGLRGKVLGALGTAHRTLGRPSEAKRWTMAAHEECERVGDLEGVEIYRQNLVFLDFASQENAELRAALLEAQRLSDRGRFAASNEILEVWLPRVSAYPAHPPLLSRGKVLGLMGLNLARMGETAAAGARTREALAACIEAGDRAGEYVYRRNLETLAGTGTGDG